MAPFHSLLLIVTAVADAALMYLVFTDKTPLDRGALAWLALFAVSGALLFVSWRLGRNGRPGLGCVVLLLGLPVAFAGSIVLLFAISPRGHH
jgi:phosphoglycerol transferase MdoB-like AlkP superfamily enzyme